MEEFSILHFTKTMNKNKQCECGCLSPNRPFLFLPQNSTEGKKHYQKCLSKYILNNGMQLQK